MRLILFIAILLIINAMMQKQLKKDDETFKNDFENASNKFVDKMNKLTEKVAKK